MGSVLPGYSQKHRVPASPALGSALDFEGIAELDPAKTSKFKLRPEGGAVKTPVDLHFRPMEGTIFLVQIQQSHPAPWLQ